MTSQNNQQAHKKEPLTLAEIKACRDAIETEFRDFRPRLNIITVIGGIQSTSKAILEKQRDILALPSGQDIQNILKTKLDTPSPQSTLIALVKSKHKKMFGLSHETRHNAVLLINAANHEDTKTLTAELYAEIWKALSLIDDETHDIKECITRNNEIITPKWNEIQTASRNMFADIFAGSLLETKGQQGTLKNIAKTRCLACFQDLKSYDAKSNPFPIMLETAQMVLKDFDTLSNTASPITKALNITSEIIETMDEKTILQWQTFIDSAQEMAWGGTSIDHILGAAIYSSDNVYNRTSAYMIADILNTNPAPALQFDGYNPFSDPDSQQRNHKMACLETIEYLEDRQTEQRNAEPFFNIAMHSCQSLLDGKPNGFCAPALVAAGLNIKQNPDITKEEIASIFRTETNAIPWESIRNMHREIIALKKQGKDINIMRIIDILRQDEDTRDAAILIKELSDMNIATTP